MSNTLKVVNPTIVESLPLEGRAKLGTWYWVGPAKAKSRVDVEQILAECGLRADEPGEEKVTAFSSEEDDVEDADDEDYEEDDNEEEDDDDDDEEDRSAWDDDDEEDDEDEAKPEKLDAEGEDEELVEEDDEEEDEAKPDLMCVVRIGSNYYKMCNAFGQSERIHIDEFDERCTLEPKAAALMGSYAEQARVKAAALIAEVGQLMASLGCDPRAAIRAAEDGETKALALLGVATDLGGYKDDLKSAKKKIPKLYEQIKRTHDTMATWLKSPTVAMHAHIGSAEGDVAVIDQRIFSLDLYAGLSETLKLVKRGKPASAEHKLTLYQRLCFMDEESLLDYKAGGLEFENIKAFDRWLCRPDNFERLLPAPRCIVAFQVRRKTKDRGPVTTLSQAILFSELAKLDRYTFLYIRNGNRMYRLGTDFDFKAKLFPDMNRTALDEPLMARAKWGRITDDNSIVTRRDWEARVEAAKNGLREARQRSGMEGRAWSEEHKLRDLLEEWVPFNPETVYYDDIGEKIQENIRHYNHVAVILQGLFDRSEALHPHSPVKLWTATGFAEAIELVYDVDKALYPTDLPDIEGYLANLAAQITTKSVTYRQYQLWHAAKKKTAFNDQGPSIYARPTHISKTGKCTFTWERRRVVQGNRRTRAWYPMSDTIKMKFVCDRSKLFNLSAYKTGDFKQFFADPRTRELYLKWAPLLLRGEDFQGGALYEKGGEFVERREEERLKRLAAKRREEEKANKARRKKAKAKKT